MNQQTDQSRESVRTFLEDMLFSLDSLNNHYKGVAEGVVEWAKSEQRALREGKNLAFEALKAAVEEAAKPKLRFRVDDVVQWRSRSYVMDDACLAFFEGRDTAKKIGRVVRD